MTLLSGILGILLIVVILGDAFETIVLPRRVTRKVRLARLFFRSVWIPWSTVVHFLAPGRRQETWLSFYGPLSLLLLLLIWATGLIFGFALLLKASATLEQPAGGPAAFSTYFYLSGTTFFTLGLGDVVPHTPLGRALVAFEGGMGFGFLALVISYLPLLNQAFSRREVNISLLDARAGSPPTAAEILCRHQRNGGDEALRQLLRDWEQWSAELLESHLSYPVLAYFRSQHDNQSWLGALTAILDTCALVIAAVETTCGRQAELTFAIARHAIVDLSIVFRKPPQTSPRDRLPEPELARLRSILTTAGVTLREGNNVDQKLNELRLMYEPYVDALARFLHLAVPPWTPDPGRIDNWQTSAWELFSRLPKDATARKSREKHF